MVAVSHPAWRSALALGTLVAMASCSEAREYRAANCRGPGSVTLEFSAVEAPTCPTITSYLVEPLDVYLGHAISVSATATASGDAGTSFAWSAPNGFFEDPGNAETVYVCTQPGNFDIALTVAGNGCADIITTTVYCLDPDAG